MITLIEKPAMPGTTMLVIVLVIVLIVGLTLLQVSCKKKPPQDSDESQETNATTTGHEKSLKTRRTIRPTDENITQNDTNAPKEIASTDLLSFDMSITNGSGDIQGYVDLALYVFNESDEYLLKRAGNNVQAFKELGYMLSIDAAADRVPEYESRIDVALPVDKDFTIRFAEAVRQSGVMAINGQGNWTSGLPEDAGEFVLGGKYAPGDYLSISVNSYLPDEGIALYRTLRPLLIDALMEAEEDYVPLLNLDGGTTTPGELVKGIHMSQSHMLKTETYNFSLMIDAGHGYLTGNFTDEEGEYGCNFIEMESADSERLIRSFVQSRHYYASEKGKDDSSKTDAYPGVVYDETTYSFSASFHGISKSFLPIRGIVNEVNEDLETVFRELVKKYSE